MNISLYRCIYIYRFTLPSTWLLIGDYYIYIGKYVDIYINIFKYICIHRFTLPPTWLLFGDYLFSSKEPLLAVQSYSLYESKMMQKRGIKMNTHLYR
jgi:hypothetical protein